MAISKVVKSTGEVLIDLTADTVAEGSLLAGATAHGKDGEAIVGTCAYDSDTSDATAAAAEILESKTAYARGSVLTGTMPNRGTVTGSITLKAQEYPIPAGFHDGGGRVAIDAVEQAKLIPANIKKGITLLGVVGDHDGAGAVTAQSKSVTPSFAVQTVLPDEGSDYLSQVTVAAIPYAETPNSAGGITVTIG